MQKKELIITGLGSICGFLAGIIIGQINVKRNERLPENTSGKFVNYFKVLDKWMCLKEEGKSVEQYFINHGYKQIAIYGIAKMSNHLIAELEGSDIEIAYGIDRRAEILYADMPIYDLKDEWPNADVVVVTPIYEYDNIVKFLKDKVNCPIVSLADVVYG